MYINKICSGVGSLAMGVGAIATTAVGVNYGSYYQMICGSSFLALATQRQIGKGKDLTTSVMN